MKNTYLILTIVLASSLLLIACGAPEANNAATAKNGPANASNAANNTAANPATTDADVKKMMGDIAAALAKNDPDAAARFYADDYHLVTPDGVDQNKAERMADMRSGATKFESFSYENINVRSYGDTAIAIATVKAKGVVAGKPRSNDMRATLVFRKMADGWKVVSGQATPVTAVATAPASNTAKTASNAPPPAANK